MVDWQQAPSLRYFYKTTFYSTFVYMHLEVVSIVFPQIAGPPGSGKTQFCLMLCVIATLPPSLGGLGVKVAYIALQFIKSPELVP